MMTERDLYNQLQGLLQGLEREEKRLYMLEKSFKSLQKRAYESLFKTEYQIKTTRTKARLQELSERKQETESLLYDINAQLQGVAVSLYEIDSHRKKALQVDLDLPIC